MSNCSWWIGVGNGGDGDPLVEQAVNPSATQHYGMNVTGEDGQISEHLAHVVIEQLKVTQDQ